MESLSGQVPSDEESGNNDNTEVEQQLKFLKKWLGWLSFSGPAAIGIAGYQQTKKIQNSNVNGLLHASTILMALGFILALTLWILTNIVNGGRQGFLERLKYGVVSVTVLVAVAVILVIVAGFF